jgi:hypothetical protein
MSRIKHCKHDELTSQAYRITLMLLDNVTNKIMTRKSVPTTALPRTATATSSYRTRLVPGAPQPTSYRYPIPFRKFSSNHNEIPQLQQRPDQEMAHGSFIHDDHLDLLSCPHPRPRTHSSHSSSLPARRPHLPHLHPRHPRHPHIQYLPKRPSNSSSPSP